MYNSVQIVLDLYDYFKDGNEMDLSVLLNKYDLSKRTMQRYIEQINIHLAREEKIVLLNRKTKKYSIRPLKY